MAIFNSYVSLPEGTSNKHLPHFFVGSLEHFATFDSDFDACEHVFVVMHVAKMHQPTDPETATLYDIIGICKNI